MFLILPHHLTHLVIYLHPSFFCVPISLYTQLSLHTFISLPSIHPSMHPCIHPSIHLTTDPPNYHPSLYSCMHASMYPSSNLWAHYACTHASISLCIHPMHLSISSLAYCHIVTHPCIHPCTHACMHPPIDLSCPSMHPFITHPPTFTCTANQPLVSQYPRNYNWC